MEEFLQTVASRWYSANEIQAGVSCPTCHKGMTSKDVDPSVIDDNMCRCENSYATFDEINQALGFPVYHMIEIGQVTVG